MIRNNCPSLSILRYYCPFFCIKVGLRIIFHQNASSSTDKSGGGSAVEATTAGGGATELSDSQFKNYDEFYFDVESQVRGFGSGFWPITRIQGSVPRGVFLKLYWINILNNFKSILFCFHNFLLDPENQHWYGKIWTVFETYSCNRGAWHQITPTKRRRLKISWILMEKNF